MYRLIFLYSLLVTIPLRAQQWTFTTGSPVAFNNTLYNDLPVMVKASNGNILNFYRAATSHSTSRGVVMLKTSTDNGSNWAPFSGTNYCTAGDPSGCLFGDSSSSCDNSTAGCDYRELSGGITAAGTIVLFWRKYNWNPLQNLGVYFSRSTDNGITWSTPVSPASLSNYNCPSNEGFFVTPSWVAVTLVDGLCAPGHMYLVLSCNDGQSWGNDASNTNCPNPVRQVTDSDYAQMPTNEATFLWVGGNQIIGFCRNSNGGANQYPLIFMSSADMGSTWTIATTNFPMTPPPPGQIVGLWENPSPWLIDPGLGGPVTLLYAEREQMSVTGINKAYLHSITFDPQAAIGNPGGFGSTQILWSGNYIDFGYPTVVKTSAGSVLMEWFSEQIPAGPENLFTLTAQYQTSANADFTISAGSLAPTSVTAGQSATSTITVTSLNGFQSAVGLSCNVSPPGPGCSLTPSSVTPVSNSYGATTLTITTAPRMAKSVHPSLVSEPADRSYNLVSRNTRWLYIFGPTLAGLALGSDRWRKRAQIGFLLGCLLFTGLAFMTACRSGSSGNQTSSNGNGTSPGTYIVTITGTSGAITRATTVTLAVQ